MIYNSNKRILHTGCMVFMLMLVFSLDVKSQDESNSQFIEAEKRISQLSMQLVATRTDDSLLFQLNDSLVTEFEYALNKEGSFFYPFDSIKHIGKISSKDGLLRIFTWNMVKADGSHSQLGFVQYLLKAEKKVLLYQLVDKSEGIDHPETKVLTPEKWYGATYYQVIEKKGENGTLYTLIGWDGNNLYSSKKVIDVLAFDKYGAPKFGEPIFKFGKIITNRVIFEFSRMVTMMIRWDDNYQMIVMDHLAPNNSIYEGNFKYYGPDLSYDGLKFENSYWVYVPAIDYKKTGKSRIFTKKSKSSKKE